jgi:hypothetical protein
MQIRVIASFGNAFLCGGGASIELLCTKITWLSAFYLKQLRLSGILDALEARNRQAIDAKLSYVDFLALLIEDEVAREQKKLALRMRRAAFRTNLPA